MSVVVCSIVGSLLLAIPAGAQRFQSSVETWGQTYRPAGLVNMEARSYLYPWIRAETQVWAGQAPHIDDPTGHVVVLAAHVQEPTGHFALHAGRFVLATGAVRPVHLDGGQLLGRTSGGSQLEVFSGVPVAYRLSERAFDWLVGGRASQRLGSHGVLGASYVHQRDRGREINEELGADMALYLSSKATLNGRAAYDLASRGIAEVSMTSSYGNVERRVEVFGAVRNASLILPSTSLFSVLSNAPSVQSGVSGRIRVAPRLRLDGLLAYRAQDDSRAVRARAGGRLALSDDDASAIEGAITRDGVGEAQWTGVRVMVIRELMTNLRLMGEVELVAPDRPNGKGAVWPWGRLSARYVVVENWQVSVGAEGSSSPQFTRLFQALARVSYQFETGTP